jgi:hypothetical protein
VATADILVRLEILQNPTQGLLPFLRLSAIIVGKKSVLDVSASRATQVGVDGLTKPHIAQPSRSRLPYGGG